LQTAQSLAYASCRAARISGASLNRVTRLRALAVDPRRPGGIDAPTAGPARSAAVDLARSTGWPSGRLRMSLPASSGSCLEGGAVFSGAAWRRQTSERASDDDCGTEVSESFYAAVLKLTRVLNASSCMFPYARATGSHAPVDFVSGLFVTTIIRRCQSAC
jgi:hypothetical protein